ncbi:MAG TPA: serine/threonine-protein kinase, partial [Chthoniobacterales bacterium]|nr:serine/threonine-protein kinase [Chthoniobacterales bacterium]
MADAERYQHYEVLRQEDGSLWELGRGAMGITYKAFDTNLRCLVALKVINNSYLNSELARQRFLREARAAASLRHQNVASVFHLGTDHESYFYAMEFIDGETVDAYIKRQGSLDPAEALGIALQVSRALAAADKEQLVHRDLKPSNLMLVEEDDEKVVKVIDFGLAKSTQRGGESSGTLTVGGGFVGTPHFASPEQLEERDIDIRSDIYSLGATLYYILAGRPPYSGSVAQIMSQHLYKPVPLQPLDGFPTCVVELILPMMEKDPAKRPQRPSDLRREILPCLGRLRPDATGGSSLAINAPGEQPDQLATLDLSTQRPGAEESGTLVAQRYRIVALLADMPHGRRFLADDRRRARKVSLLLLADLSTNEAALDSESYARMKPDLVRAAEEGFVPAMLMVARSSQETDRATALKWYQAAASKGSVEAMKRAGDLLYSNHKRPDDDLKALNYFTQAANTGDPEAEYLVGECYFFGKGTVPDINSAVPFLQQAVARRYVKAMDLLGTCYRKLGKFEQARRSYEEAAAAGYAISFYNLGVLYMNGEGVPRNPKKAGDQFKQSAQLSKQGAERGDVVSMFYYANWLEQGIGVPKDA